jgi:hypothetical protein
LGGGSGSGLADRITALQESLMTETELLTEWYETSGTALDEALEAELLKHDEHKEAKLRLDEEYRRRSAEISDAANQSEVDGKRRAINAMIGFMTGMGKKNEALAKVSVAVNAARAIREASQNISVAATKAMELGPILGPPAAAKVKMWGALEIASIAASAAMSASGGGGGGGGGGGSTATAAAPAQQQATTFAFTLQNDPMGFGESFARQMIEQLNEAQRNGGQVRGVLA